MPRAASRLRHLLAANFNALLERAEDPEKMLRAIVHEMDETRSQLIRTRDDLREELAVGDREAGRHRRRVAHWQAQAEAALGDGDEERARQAIAQRHDAETAARTLAAEQDRLKASVQRVEDDMVRLDQRRVQAEQQARTLAGRTREMQVMQRHASPADAVLERSRERLERIERRLERMEARIESYDVAPAPPAEVPALTRAVDEELAALKARLKAPDPVDADD